MNTNNKILVIQTSFIGDAVLTLPMIQELKKKYPDYLIDVLAIPIGATIFENSEFVNNVIVYDKRGKDKGFRNLLKLGKKLKGEGYCLLYSAHRSFRTALLVLLAEVKETFGFDSSSLKYAYKNIVKYNLNEHEVLRNLRLIDFKNEKENWRILPKVDINQSVQDKISNYLLSINTDKYICIAPGSVWETKKYPLEYYQVIVKYFVEKGISVIITGSEKETDICNQLEITHQGKVFSSAGKFSIIETIELIKRSSLLICNDSAPTHFGMVGDIPVITIYCSTVPKFGFYPYNDKSTYVSLEPLKCKPCGIHGYKKCPIETFECGMELNPETIIEKIERILN